MILKNEDFKGFFKIANSQDIAPMSNLLGNVDELTEFIVEFVPECLILVLGYELFEELKAELDPNETNGLKPTADQKYDDLLNGKDNYKGLKPILVPYIYYKFLESDESKHSGVGVIKDRAKGANEFNSIAKAVKAWRTFYKNAVGEDNTPTEYFRNSNIFGGLSFVDFSNGNDNRYWSLYKFLYERKADFENATPSYIEQMNRYGI